MRRLHTGVVSALALVLGMGATQADAQSLRGFRAEGQVGVTSFHSEGNHKSKIGWGAAVGVDAYVANNFVLGVEGAYWDSRPENVGIDGPGEARHKMFQEWGIALRAGAMVTPSTLIYGRVGYVRDEQRKEFVPFLPGTTTVGGAVTPGYYYDHYHATGIQWGGGVEQLVMSNVYVKAEGRYSDYKRHTHALTGLLGLGVLFGPTAEAAPPPPPPPPPPPAQRGERG